MIYLDHLHDYPPEAIRDPRARRLSRTWAHLWCDPGNEEELHATAQALGLHRSWFQNKPGFPHYDLVPARHRAALEELNVRLTDLKDWLKARQAK